MYLQVHVQMLLSKSQNPNSSLWLSQVVVDADEGFHRRLRAALVFVLFVVQGFCKCMALLGQSPERPACMTELRVVLHRYLCFL